MYQTLGSLKNVIHRKADDPVSLQRILNIIGNEDTLQYLESILKAFRLNKINSATLNDTNQILWIMEIFSYGLTQSFSKYESINEIIQIYYGWLSTLKSSHKPNLPKPIIEDPHFFAFKILDQLYYTFLPRLIDTSPENLGYQAAACIQILLIINNLTEDIGNNSQEIYHELWEHILILLIRINDTLLSALSDSEGQEYITLGNLVGSHSIKTLFEVWLRSGLTYFPTPPFWKTLEEMCGSAWKFRYLPLIEQWNRCNTYLSHLLITKIQIDDPKTLVEGHEITSLFLPITTPLHVIAQYWLRVLHVLGSPQDLLYQCLAKFSQINMGTNKMEKGQTNPYFDQRAFSADDYEINVEQSKKGGPRRVNPFQRKMQEKINLTQMNPLNSHLTPLAIGQLQLCSILFFRFMTGIARLVDFYLGFLNDGNGYDLSKSPNISLNSPPTPPVRKRAQGPKDKKSAVDQLGNSAQANNHIPLQSSASVPSRTIPLNSSLTTATSNNPVPMPTTNPPTNPKNPQPPKFNIGITNTFQQIGAGNSYQNISSVPVDKSSAHGPLPPHPPGISNPDQPNAYVTHQRKRTNEFFVLTMYPYDTVWKNSANGIFLNRAKDSIICPKLKCSLNTLLSLYGDWLFACASLNTISYPFAWVQTFNFGKGEACGTLCRIMCHHITGETILPTYLFRFYLTIYSALTLTTTTPPTPSSVTGGNDSYHTTPEINVIQASILCNSYDLFRVDLDGISMLLPEFLKLVTEVLHQPPKSSNPGNQTEFLGSDASSSFVLRNAAIHILSSVVCLPTQAPNVAIETLQPTERVQEASLESLQIPRPQLTYGQLRDPIMNALYVALENESNTTNLNILLALLCLTLQDFASYQTEVNDMTHQHLSQSQGHKIYDDTEKDNAEKFAPNSTRQYYKLRSGKSRYSRASIPVSVYDSCATLNKESKPEFWCFDCMFEAQVDTVLKTFDKWQHEEYSVAHLCLAALSHFAKIRMLIYKPVCESIIRRLCEHVVRMCSFSPTKHTKDVHTLIVALYNCLTIWLTYHFSLLDDADILYLLLETAELGITGQKSKIDDKTCLKEDKECRPVSKRVANASEYLLNVILVLNHNANTQQSSSTFTFHHEISLLQQSNIDYHYYGHGSNLILGIFEIPGTVSTNPVDIVKANFQRILVVHNQYGRYVWTVSYEKAEMDLQLKDDPSHDTTPSFQRKTQPVRSALDDKYQARPFNTVRDHAFDKSLLGIGSPVPADLSIPSIHEVPIFPDKSTLQSFDQLFQDALAFEESTFCGRTSTTTDKCLERKPGSDITLQPDSLYGLLKPENYQKLKYKTPKLVKEVDIPGLFLSQLRFSETGLNAHEFPDKSGKLSLVPLQSVTNRSSENKAEFVDNLVCLDSIQTVPLDVAWICFVGKNQKSIYDIFGHKDVTNTGFADFMTLLSSNGAEGSFNKDNESSFQNKTLMSYDAIPYSMIQDNCNDEVHNHYTSIGTKENGMAWKDLHWEIRFILNPITDTYDNGLFGDILSKQTNESTCLNFYTETRLDNGTIDHKTTRSSFESSLLASYESHFCHINPKYGIAPSSLAPSPIFKKSRGPALNYTTPGTCTKRISTSSLTSTVCTADDGNASITTTATTSSSISASVHTAENQKQGLLHLSGSYSQKPYEHSHSKILYVIAWLEQFQDNGTFPLGHLYDVFNGSNASTDSKTDIQVIFIHPLSNGLFRIAVRSTLSGRATLSFPLTEGLVVSKTSLLPLIRETIIHSSQMKKFENENYQMPEIARKQKIQNVISTYRIKQYNDLYDTILL